LNLTFETREGILKHCSRLHAEELDAGEPGGVGQRFLHGGQPSLEAQLCNLADEIAYNAHDIDDGVRSGLITLEQLQQVALFDDFRRQALTEFAHLQEASAGRRLLYDSIRRMLSAQVDDVIGATRSALQQAAPHSADEVRQMPALVQFGADMKRKSQDLKHFLLHQLYRHPRVLHTTGQARQMLHSLFGAYLAHPEEMQPRFVARFDALHGVSVGSAAASRVIADYIAGMTDRFATREHERLMKRDLLVEFSNSVIGAR
jgi:dGTPase